jgi:hypothetical protein
MKNLKGISLVVLLLLAGMAAQTHVGGGGSGGGGGGDTITSPSGTITVGGTNTATTVDFALGHANTWTGQQTFVAPILGTPASVNIANATGLQSAQVTTALGYTPPTPPVVLPCTTSCTVTAAYTIVVCTNACVVTPLPPSTAGNQLCVRNAPGSNTVITLAALGAGNFYELITHAGYGTANHTVLSSGAYTDFSCWIGLDANHYLVAGTPVNSWTD